MNVYHEQRKSNEETPMLRRLLLAGLILGISLAHTGDVLAARCKPLKDGKCNACKNCKYCKHCSKDGGKCSVCK